MNKIERIYAALHGDPVDQVPASFWVHFPPEQRNGHAMAQAHLEFYHRTNPDFLKVMNDNPYCLVDIDQIRTPADWRKLRPAPLSSRPYQEYLDGLKEILDMVGSETFVIVTVFNPFAAANDNHTGHLDYSDTFFSFITEHLHQDARSTTQGLSVVAESLAEFSRACIQAGAAGIFFSANGGEHGRFTLQEFHDWIEPSDLIVLNAAKEAGAEFNLLHICGTSQRLNAYLHYPVQAVNWAPQQNNLSLSEGRSLFQKTIIGGLDQRGVLTTGPREAIEAEVQSVLTEIGSQNFILGAGCAVVGKVPPEHFVWAREAASRKST
jgi:uroporphyrinogen decarboxylase